MTCDEHSLIADVAVVADGKVLPVKHADTNRYDHQAGWFLPDDSIRHLEHPERAAVRIGKEQLGLDVRGVRMSHIESCKENDGSWHMPFHFVADFDRAQTIAPSSHIAAAQWFGLDTPGEIRSGAPCLGLADSFGNAQEAVRGVDRPGGGRMNERGT